MQPILIVYATREGHTRQVAEHLGVALRQQRRSFELVDAAHLLPGFDLNEYSAAIACASVHMGKYESEMVRFVKHHVAELQELPGAFISVSLAEAGVEAHTASPRHHEEAEVHIRKTIHDFLVETGWHPMYVKAVAGALTYSKYNFITRFIMKRIAAKNGMPTDTSRDYEFTDWTGLDRFIQEFTAALPSPQFARIGALQA